jgi:NADPH:quinone reductase-like Zn-dependent oxidoreductase
MQAIIYEQTGDPVDVMTAVERPLPEPGPGQVRIRMRMAPIHNHDMAIVRGGYGIAPPLPGTPGTEGLGIVDKLGEGVAGFSVGQRVTGGGMGTWSEYYLANAQGLAPLPDAVPDETGCQLFSMPMSAFRLLGNLEVNAGDWVIQNAPHGIVGIIFARLAAQRGVNVVNLVRRESAIAELAVEGIGNAVSSEYADWRERVKAVTGGAPIVRAIDSIAGRAANDLLDVVAEEGWLISFGLLSGEPVTIDKRNLLYKRATIKGFWGAKPERVVPPAALAAQRDEFIRQAASGELKLPVSAAFAVTQPKQAAQVHAAVGRGGTVVFRGTA